MERLHDPQPRRTRLHARTAPDDANPAPRAGWPPKSKTCAASWNRPAPTSLRERADLDNQRKRLGRDVEQARRFANESLLSELLPVFDSLEAGLAAAGNEPGPLREGLELTFRQLLEGRRGQRPEHGRPGRRGLRPRTAPGR